MRRIGLLFKVVEAVKASQKGVTDAAELAARLLSTLHVLLTDQTALGNPQGIDHCKYT